MENIKNTTKYLNTIKIVSIAMVFAVAMPVIALADDDYYYDTNINSGYDYSYDTNINSGYNYVYNQPNYNSTVTSGGYYGGNNYGNYGYGSGASNYSQSSTVTSGSFTAQPNNGTAPVYYIAPVSTVTAASYTATPNDGTAPVYYNAPASTVTSGGFSNGSATLTYYSYQPSTQVIPNQVLAYTNTNPIVSSTYLSGESKTVADYTNTSNLSSVYLSDIPSTGFEDYYGTILFILILVSWSAALAYIFLKRKVESKEILATVGINGIATDSIKTVNSELLNQMVSDNSDMNKVEEYARMKKVLLSGDAAAKLIKLSRLGKINAAEFIRSVSTGEWLAVGENQIN